MKELLDAVWKADKEFKDVGGMDNLKKLEAARSAYFGWAAEHFGKTFAKHSDNVIYEALKNEPLE